MDKHATAQEVHFRSRICTLALDGRNLCIIDERSASKDGFALDYKSVTIREGAIRLETTAIKDLVIVRISDGGTGGFVTLPMASGNEALPITSTVSAVECTKCRVSDTSGIRVEQRRSNPVHALQKKPRTSERTSKYKRAPSWGTGSGGESWTGYWSGVEPPPFSISPRQDATSIEGGYKRGPLHSPSYTRLSPSLLSLPLSTSSIQPRKNKPELYA